MSQPPVSIILPVFNGAADIAQSIDCMLAQTFGDFELIVIDDGSTDDTAAVVDGFTDPRLRFVRQSNRGLAAALNRGIELARGTYLARQDHDDISRQDRLACQVAYMQAHPDCALLGTWAEIWRDDAPSGRNHDHPTDDAALRFELLFNNPFVHSSVMLRADLVRAAGGYATDPARQPPEDYELWSRLARHHRVANLPERLVIYREVPTSISRNTSFQDKLVLIGAENLAAATGAANPSRDMWDIAALTHGAAHLVSPRPSLRRMARLLAQAGERIRDGRTDTDVAERVRAHQARLAYICARQRHPWLSPALGLARRTVRRFGF